MDSSLMMNIVLIVAVVWFFYRRFASVKGLRNLDGEAFARELQSEGDKIVIDVREPFEYSNGFIPGAVNIPLSELPGKLQDAPPDRPVYLYCQSGIRSRHAARILAARGFSNIAHLAGGLRSWKGPLRRP
jgi:rhodanese-related sulfurtransferase